MHFEYVAHTTTEDSIDIDNIGNCCLSACNAIGMEWLLVINTILGDTKIIEYGPINANDCEKFYESLYYSYNQIAYHKGKLERRIDGFLNNPSRDIIQAQEITLEEAKQKIKSIVEYI